MTLSVLHDETHEYKGREIRVFIEGGGGLMHGRWLFSYDGSDYGNATTVVTNGWYDVIPSIEADLLRDAKLLIDEPEEYARRSEEEEDKRAEEAARRKQDARETNEVYRDIVDRAVAEVGEDVEPYLREAWDHWVEG